jgi:tetratricopeptide (TPR) repeat protein
LPVNLALGFSKKQSTAIHQLIQMQTHIYARTLFVSVMLCVPLLSASQVNSCLSGFEATEKGRNEEAIRLLTSCLNSQLPPRSRSAALQARAVALLETKRAEEALRDQLAAFALVAPTKSEAFATLSAIQRALGRFDGALATLKQAESIDDGAPGSGPGMAIWYHKGLTYMAMKRPMDAVTAFTKGIPKQPDYAPAYYHRGLAYEMLGAKENAKHDFQQAALRTSPDNEFPPEFFEKLKAYSIDLPSPNQ